MLLTGIPGATEALIGVLECFHPTDLTARDVAQLRIVKIHAGRGDLFGRARTVASPPRLCLKGDDRRAVLQSSPPAQPPLDSSRRIDKDPGMTMVRQRVVLVYEGGTYLAGLQSHGLCLRR